MKQIIAIVKPFLAERVLKAISKFDVEEIVVREAKGFGRQKDYVDLYRNNEFSLMFVAKVEVSVFADDSVAEKVIEAMTLASRTGRLGDGKILVLPILEQRSEDT
ncbi:MAG: P-II family nitrogen regulator [Pirellulaceae bacterium]